MATPHAHFASASLYVGDLHKDVTEAMLYEVFNSVGPVASIRVCRDSSTRRSLGYAYVNYHSVGDAERALDTLNYTHIKNMPCRIMWSHRDPSLRKSGAGNIFVKNLDKAIDNKALYDTFSLFGNILSCKVSQDEIGKSRGFGFVHYETEAAADTAIERVNRMKIGTKTVFVGHFKKRSERTSQMEDKYTNVYVKNIPAEWDEGRVTEAFAEFGEVTSVAIQTDARGRKFGFVNFTDAGAAKEAVQHLHQKKVAESAEGEKGVKKEGEGEEENEGVEEKVKTEPDEGDQEDKASKASDDEKSPDADPTRLYVTRFQPRAERMALLKSKFDQSAEQRQKKMGVNLFIKNIHDSVDDAALRELFEPFGTITSAKVMYDGDRSRGFGFVSFLSPDEATKAVTEMHLKLVEGKPLYVGVHEKREERNQRLQQKLRVQHMRPRMPAGFHQSIQFGGPPQMYFGGSSGMQQQPGGPLGYPPHPNRAAQAGGYPQTDMMSWSRGQPAVRGYGQQQPGMGPQLSMGGYAPLSPSAAAGHAMSHPQAAGGGSPLSPMAMGPVGGPAGMNPMVRGARMVNNQMQPQVGPKQMPGGATAAMAMQQKPQGFKFPPQAVRTRDMGDPNLWAAAGAGGMGGMSAMAATGAGGQVLPAGGGVLPGMHEMAAMSNAAGDLLPPAMMQKQVLGERLFPLIQRLQPSLAGKITGMMLDMENSELINLLQSEAQLKAKVDEALRVLEQAGVTHGGPLAAMQTGGPSVAQQMASETEV